MNFTPWRPGDPISVPRFGLTPAQWQRMLELHARYATNSHGDVPEPVPPPRLRFLKHLVRTGRVNEGGSHGHE